MVYSREDLVSILAFFGVSVAVIGCANAGPGSSSQAQLNGTAALVRAGSSVQREPETSPIPTPEPTAEPTAVPTALPTALPSAEPSAQPVSEVPSSRMCSNMGTAHVKSNLFNNFSAGLGVTAVLAPGASVTKSYVEQVRDVLLRKIRRTDSGSWISLNVPSDYIAHLQSTGTFELSIPSGAHVADGGYDLFICGAAGCSPGGVMFGEGRVVVANNKISVDPAVSKNKIYVLYAQNAKALKAAGADNDCDAQYSPLVLDMDHGAVPNSSFAVPLTDPSVSFDIDGNGGKEKISWLASPDRFAFLTLPVAGKVTSVKQLFGDGTVGPDGKRADDGFGALAKYDLNHDCKIDHNDAIYSKLQLWFDRRSNGVVDAGELKSLADAGIASISVCAEEMYQADANNNLIQQRASYQTVSGAMGMVYDVWFNVADGVIP